MRALDDRVVEAVWQAIEFLVPKRRKPDHPLGCHRRRIPDRGVFPGDPDPVGDGVFVGCGRQAVWCG